MEQIIAYLKNRYAPLAIIVYGSYTDGTQNQNSDFDVFLIVPSGEKAHDSSVINGVLLDAFIYPQEMIEGKEANLHELVQISEGMVILDTAGIGARLQARVQQYLQELPKKQMSELAFDVEWCEKMLLRTQRGDAEGFFRWHWVLVDSLEIACALFDEPYRGPKKSLRWLQAAHPELFAVYEKALQALDAAALAEWIACLKTCLKGRT